MHTKFGVSRVGARWQTMNLLVHLVCSYYGTRPRRAHACVWGPAARKFFRECLALADDDRDIDLYHWSSTRFNAVWRDTLSVLVARGRAQVSVAAAVADWPKRIRDMRYVDHEDYDGTD